ncbi:hypothetical protein [Desulfosporosinus burensis]
MKEEVIQIVSLLRDEKILADSKDLNAFIKKKESKKNSLSILKTYGQIEKFLLTILSDEEKIIHLKELNEQAEASACEDVSPNKIKTILNLWAIKNWIKRQTTPKPFIPTALTYCEELDHWKSQVISFRKRLSGSRTDKLNRAKV